MPRKLTWNPKNNCGEDEFPLNKGMGFQVSTVTTSNIQKKPKKYLCHIFSKPRSPRRKLSNLWSSSSWIFMAEATCKKLGNLNDICGSNSKKIRGLKKKHP